jgi:hypothetical protein
MKMLGTVLQTNSMSKLRLSIGLGLVLSLVGIAPAVQAQQHAPTAEQCRADQRLWLSELEGPPGPPASIGSIGYPELLKRSDEMYACRAVDPDFEHQYYNAMAEFAFARAVRLEAFLRFHKLYDQFVTEDAQGRGRYRSQSQ